MTRHDPAEAGPNQRVNSKGSKRPRRVVQLYKVEWERGHLGKSSRVYRMRSAAERLAAWKRDAGYDGVKIFVGEIVWKQLRR